MLKVLALASFLLGGVVAAKEEEVCKTGCDGVVASEVGDEKSQKDYYEKASHYDKIWGDDNLHLGYFPHLSPSSATTVRLDHKQAASVLNERMISLAGIKNGTKILDLGAGKGRACYEMALLTGASCTGIDLATVNVERGNAIAAENPDLDLKFIEGSFTALPDEARKEKYDVVFAQVSFCHVHQLLDKIFEEVASVLTKDTLFVINDYLGSDWEPAEATKTHVYTRLHFQILQGPRKWRDLAAEAGLTLLHYETLDKHMQLAYEDMAAAAKKLDIVSTDGTPLYINYEETAKAIARRDIGMNLALFSL